MIGLGDIQATLEALIAFAILYTMGLMGFNFECARLPLCRSMAIREAARRALPGVGFAVLMLLAGLSLKEAVGTISTVYAVFLYALAILLLFAVYDSVTMFLINGFTSLAVRGEAGPRVRAKLLVEAATPFYWIMVGAALLLVQIGDLVLQPSTRLVAIGGSVVAAIVLYVVARRAHDKWVWTLRYLEAAGAESVMVETLRNLISMARFKPVIAILIGVLAAFLGADRSSYAYFIGAFIYTIPVYKAVSLYVYYAFARPKPPGETRQTGGLEPEAVRAARDLFYTSIISVSTATLIFSSIVFIAALTGDLTTGLIAIASYGAALVLYKNLRSWILSLNVLAPVMVELTKTVADAIRRIVKSSCNGEKECCMLARLGCTASTNLAPRLVEAACRG